MLIVRGPSGACIVYIVEAVESQRLVGELGWLSYFRFDSWILIFVESTAAVLLCLWFTFVCVAEIVLSEFLGDRVVLLAVHLRCLGSWSSSWWASASSCWTLACCAPPFASVHL